MESIFVNILTPFSLISVFFNYSVITMIVLSVYTLRTLCNSDLVLIPCLFPVFPPGTISWESLVIIVNLNGTIKEPYIHLKLK